MQSGELTRSSTHFPGSSLCCYRLCIETPIASGRELEAGDERLLDFCREESRAQHKLLSIRTAILTRFHSTCGQCLHEIRSLRGRQRVRNHEQPEERPGYGRKRGRRGASGCREGVIRRHVYRGAQEATSG